jgi:glyceraldehyde 3-phosphate dehydrogenase
MERIAINGLGRIGRAAFKLLMSDPELEIVAVNDVVPAYQLAYLLNFDSVYGKLENRVSNDDYNLYFNGRQVRVLNQRDPSQLPWREMGIDIVLECSGKYTRRDELQKHIDAGARRVLLSAPSKSNDVITVVHGVNRPEEQGELQIISCASCTTNCIAPITEIMARRIGIKKAVMTTLHAVTSNQSVVDMPGSDLRRGRSANTNFIPTSTGAALTTAKVLPQLQNKFNGIAVRGPVPIGSLADITFITERPTSIEEINSIFGQEAASERYVGIVGVNVEPIVSSDIIKDPRASVVDLSMTQVVDGDLVKILSWYDNEWGYVNQMVKEAKRISKQNLVLMEG